jgi:replicative DNA helicase
MALDRELMEEYDGLTGNTPMEWDVPVSFDEQILPVFPVDVFPVWLRDYVEGVAESTQTPIDAPAMAAISVLSTALAKKYYVCLTPEWKESLNTYGLLALPPGNRKSSVFKALQEPITVFEKEEHERLKPEVNNQKVRIKALKKRLEQLEKDFARKSDKKILQQIYALNDEINSEEPLTLPRFITGDVTAEMLGILMAENNEKMAVLSAEGGVVFSNMAGRYSKDGKANIEIYLNGHSSDYTSIDRIGRESITLEAPCLTIGLFVQPEVVRDVPPTFKERGLMQRFLYSFPRSLVGYRKISPNPINPSIKNQYMLNVNKLMQINTKKEVKITLDQTANQSEKELRQELETMFLDGGILSDMKEWGSKLAGQIIRIAGLLHVAEHIQANMIPDQISASTFNNARKLTPYFIEHAKAAYGFMEVDQSTEDAKYLLEVIKRQQKPVIEYRGIQMLTRKRFKKAESLKSTFNELEERGFIHQRKEGKKVVYDVTPYILKESTHNSHNNQKTLSDNDGTSGYTKPTLDHKTHNTMKNEFNVGNVGNCGSGVQTSKGLEPQRKETNVGNVGTIQGIEEDGEDLML